MSRKERERLVVFSRLKDKQLSRVAAAAVLGLSLRQVHRLYRRFLDQGDQGLIHRSRGRSSPRRIDAGRQDKALRLYRQIYRGFGPTLLAEKLGADHGIWISHDTARRWLIAQGLLEKPRRGRRSRRRRVRRTRFGQMLQMDGSHHAWLENRAPRCCLMVVVDDATGQMRGRFYEGETFWAALEMFGRWCGEFGVPASLYVDRAGIYRSDREATTEELVAKRRPLTQFCRAMKELDVKLILAHSPQAKGRVERANSTLQDRLVKELRVAQIYSIQAANAWLDQSEFFQRLSSQFGVEATDGTDAHRPVVCDLNQVLCVKEPRSVANDGCVQWKGQSLQLQDARPGLRNVEVWEQHDGTLRINGGGKELRFVPWVAPAKAKKVFKNNKRHKPTAKQQIRLPGSAPAYRAGRASGLRKTG